MESHSIARDAARGLAPVPVPDAPMVSWFWSFLHTPGLGEVPAFAAVVLQVHAMPVMTSFMETLQRAGVEGLDDLPQSADDIETPADLLRVMQTIRRQVTGHPSAAAAVAAQASRRRRHRTGRPQRHGVNSRAVRWVRFLLPQFLRTAGHHLHYSGTTRSLGPESGEVGVPSARRDCPRWHSAQPRCPCRSGGHVSHDLRKRGRRGLQRR